MIINHGFMLMESLSAAIAVVR